ncbi:MAG: magnesium transporter [Planctomycetota bacterium]|nr:MAG: magnesium transporter [Planctomycetota bacterium]
MGTLDPDAPTAEDLREAWPVLFRDERVDGFRTLGRAEADDFFLSLNSGQQTELLLDLPGPERRSWIRMLAPDDAADVIQRAPSEQREGMLVLLDDTTRREVTALLAYAEDDAGGLMNTRFARVRPDMTVDEAIRYLRRQISEQLELIYYAYVLDREQVLQGVVSFRELLAAPGSKQLRDLMRTDVVKAAEDMDQEALSRLFAESDLIALPIVDAAGRMKGIVTVDDIVDVVQEEATEDIQKIGAVEALDAPYMQTAFFELFKKRAGWLTVLFAGEMATFTAMSHFEQEIHQATVLSLFVPLIISSGGNSGSQASTLIVRAIGVGELRLRDWWRVLSRELAMGVALGALLGLVGLARVIIWPSKSDTDGYAEHYALIGMTVGVSVLGVVLWGTIAGSMLPFLLKRCRLDPATASAPLVATLVDVTGLVIYFTVAVALLSGSLL